MISLSVLAAGLLLGLSIAAPVGPMGLLCINRTLTHGLLAGLAIGAGIATGDALYGAVAAFGFSAITDMLIRYAEILRLLGGGFLIWLGLRAWREIGAERTARAAGALAGPSLLRAYLIAVGLTLTNPATILSFIAAFGALGLQTRQNGAMEMVAGVFAGSAAWWLALCSTIALARHALTPAVMRWIDRLSAVLLGGLGAAALLGLL